MTDPALLLLSVLLTGVQRVLIFAKSIQTNP